MKTPITRYAQNGAARIAYQVVGQGAFDLVFIPGFVSNIEILWEEAGFARVLKRLAAFARVILLDPRGSGLSERIDPSSPPDFGARVEDVRAVMEAAGSGRAVLLGTAEGGALAIALAAAQPQRTRALVLCGASAQAPAGTADQAHEPWAEVARAWGTGASATRYAPGRDGDERFRQWWGRLERLSATPGGAAAVMRMNASIDVRERLSAVQAPTLVIHRAGDTHVRLAAGRALAQKINGARFVECPGRDHPIWLGDCDAIVDLIEEFLTGERPAVGHDRVLANLVVARLVAPERDAARLGTRLWSERMVALREEAAAAIARHGGTVIALGVTEIGARFDGCVRAVRCALALMEIARALQLALAAGVHTGEVDVRDGAVAGLALHVAERLSARAAAGEVVASGIVRDLVAGAGLRFAERGREPVEGSAPLHVLAVMAEQHLEPHVPASRTPEIESLSAREREVLVLVADGLSNAAIADRLRLSDHTVKRHVANILLKLDLPTRAAAAAFLGHQRSA